MGPNKYILNKANVAVERFAWVEAFETWAQRTSTQVNWKFTERAEGPDRWAATAHFQGHAITGHGANQKLAKKDAVIRIENGGILRI
ncbi:hypothetical protein FRC11_008860 [Ceratobasidium sp. 423]|nr:hypothetical protein FRC11_008860 [Ceratobasidium sp. 423]